MESELKMDWNVIGEWILNLGIFSIGTASITAVIGFLGKSIFQTYLTKQTETFKSELQRLTNRHQITFSKLHEERAETIKDLYTKLVELESSTRGLVDFGHLYDKEMEKERSKEVVEKSSELYQYCNVNRIYFSEDICKSLDKIHENFGTIIVTYDTYYTFRREILSEEDIVFEEERKAEMRKCIKEEIPVLKNSIEYEFRKLLGVIEDKE